MSGPRLCEVKNEMMTALVQIVQTENNGHALPVGHSISLLRCPFSNHCDKTGPCRGFTSRNRQLISEIEDEFFKRGFVKTQK
jgi:hypothetical protein